MSKTFIKGPKPENPDFSGIRDTRTSSTVYYVVLNEDYNAGGVVYLRGPDGVDHLGGSYLARNLFSSLRRLVGSFGRRTI